MLGRAAGSLARHAWMGSSRCGGTPVRSGEPLSTACTTAGTLLAAKAGRPVAANTIVPAQLKRSDAGPTRSPLNCSGDM